MRLELDIIRRRMKTEQEEQSIVDVRNSLMSSPRAWLQDEAMGGDAHLPGLLDEGLQRVKVDVPTRGIVSVRGPVEVQRHTMAAVRGPAEVQRLSQEMDAIMRERAQNDAEPEVWRYALAGKYVPNPNLASLAREHALTRTLNTPAAGGLAGGHGPGWC